MSTFNIPKKLLDNITAATTGSWVKLIEGRAHPISNDLHQHGKPSTLTLEIASGDTIRIELSNDVFTDTAGKLQLVASPKTTDSIEYNSTDTGDVIYGAWAFIRAIKTGANGPATVIISK